MELAAVPYQRAGLELFQLQAAIVKQALRIRIGGQQHLKSAIESKAFHPVGAHPPSRLISRLEQVYRHTRGFKRQSTAEARQTRSDDGYLGHPFPAVARTALLTRSRNTLIGRG